jgi:transcriptional regulator with XRE-family HTH domain
MINPYYGLMSTRLQDLAIEWTRKAGKSGDAKLAARADISPSTVRNVKHGKIPGSDIAYKIALACGCSVEDALAIAGECTQYRARESA